MAKVPGLMRRGGAWGSRIRVPDHLRQEIGKRELWKSFGAVEYKEACRLARIERAEADRLFTEIEARLRPHPVKELTDSDLRHLTRSYFYQLETHSPAVPNDPDERAALADLNDEDLILVDGSLEDASLQRVARSFAGWAKVSVEEGSPSFWRLCGAVQRALVEHHSRQADRLSLRPEQPRDEMFTDINRASPPISPLTLSKAIKLYKSDPEQSGKARKTKSEWEFRFAVAEELLGGDVPISSIGRAELREFRDILLKLPSNAPKRFRGMALRRVAALPEEQRKPLLSPKSVMLYIDRMKALFNWLVKEELAPRNPVTGLKGPPPAKSDRRPFTPVELNRLFASPSFGIVEGKEWLYWLPRVALLTGMRIAEVAGIKADDVVETDDGPFFRLERNEFRGLKNDGSIRLVPIPPQVVEAGLLELAKRRNPEQLLFPGIPVGKDGVGNPTQKAIGRRIRRIFEDTRLTFHSLRHNFMDGMRNIGAPREVAAAIGGWELEGRVTMDDYGDGHGKRVLAGWLAKLTYPGVKLNW